MTLWCIDTCMMEMVEMDTVGHATMGGKNHLQVHGLWHWVPHHYYSPIDCVMGSTYPICIHYA